MSDINSRFIAFLRSTEKYTKTDMVYLAKGGGWSVLGTIGTTIIAACTFLAFANWLPKESYGTYQYILAVADLFGIFVLAGIDTAVARATARGQEGSLMEGFYTKIRWGLIGGFGAIALGTYYLVNSNMTLGFGFIIAGVFLPFWEAPGIYGTYLQGKKQFALLNIGDVVTQLSSAMTIIPTLFFTDNILIILFVYLATWGILRMGFFLFTLRKFPPNDVHDPEVVPYGKHLSTMLVIGTVASKADTVLLWHFLGPVSVALYVFSQSIPMRATGFLKIINRLAFPKMAAQDPTELRKTLMRKVWLLVGFSTLCATVYAILAPFIFSLLLPNYMDAVPYTILASALIALQPFSLISSAFGAQADKKSLYIWSVGAPIMRIGLFLLLIPTWGLWGAMIGLITSKALESLLLMTLFHRLGKQKYS